MEMASMAVRTWLSVAGLEMAAYDPDRTLSDLYFVPFFGSTGPFFVGW